MTIKFRNPRKLGVLVESWLRTDARGFECTAATCLYFLSVLFCRPDARGNCSCCWAVSSIAVPLIFACESPRLDRLVTPLTPSTKAMPDAIAGSMADGIFQEEWERWFEGLDGCLRSRARSTDSNFFCMAARETRCKEGYGELKRSRRRPRDCDGQ